MRIPTEDFIDVTLVSEDTDDHNDHDDYDDHVPIKVHFKCRAIKFCIKYVRQKYTQDMGYAAFSGYLGIFASSCATAIVAIVAICDTDDGKTWPLLPPHDN